MNLATDCEKVIAEALELLSNDRHGDALVRFRQVLHNLPQNANNYNRVRSYYGLTLVFLGHNDDGLETCREAANTEFNDSLVFYNFAQAALISKRRALALKAISMGRVVEPSDTKLEKLRRSMGIRKPPVLKFLSRDNPVNKLLGKVRQQHFS